MTDASEQAGRPDPKTVELAALRATLAGLVEGDIQGTLHFASPVQRGGNEAALMHRTRTARYKRDQLLAMAPDAAAVSQACAYVVLRRISEDARLKEELTKSVVSILVSAGYGNEASVAVVSRLSQDTASRRAMWMRSQKRKLIGVIVAEINGLTYSVLDPK